MYIPSIIQSRYSTNFAFIIWMWFNWLAINRSKLKIPFAIYRLIYVAARDIIYYYSGRDQFEWNCCVSSERAADWTQTRNSVSRFVTFKIDVLFNSSAFHVGIIKVELLTLLLFLSFLVISIIIFWKNKVDFLMVKKLVWKKWSFKKIITLLMF